MEKYFARICWNQSGWTKPDGSASPYESKNTYVSEQGFGHEEWLFNTRHQIDGYQYGFIEGINQSKKLARGASADVILYSIGPRAAGSRRPRYIVGVLQDCQRLSDQQAASAIQYFQEAGWFDAMILDAAKVTGRSASAIRSLFIEPQYPVDLINIRFKWSKTIHPGRPELVPENHPLQSRDYYHYLYNAEQIPIATSSPSSLRSGPSGTRQPLPLPNRAKPSAALLSTETPQNLNLHIKMQNELLVMWQKEFGDCVWLESNYVDVLVQTQNRLIFCEVKAKRPASLAIREALGQILEYAFYMREETELSPELHIAGLAELTDADRVYLARLNHVFGLDITYHCVDPDED